MRPKNILPIAYPFLIVLISALACNLPGLAPTEIPTSLSATDTPVPPPTEVEPTATPFSGGSNLPTLPPPTETPVIEHIMFPVSAPKTGGLVYDVESSGTGPEGRAPYGDSYQINRFERPFLQDMTYVEDLDIVSYNVFQDENWIYVSIELIGNEPNNPMGIHYGVELDTDIDGFGDFLVWGSPPYVPEWSTDGVQVFEDQNNDTGGLSAEKSDAPLDGDGYETKIFDAGLGDDPDLAWLRVYAGRNATLQFAFKKSLAGNVFMLGVVADAGLKDVSLYDLNDRFTPIEAGSPVRGNDNYPLKALYAVDNVCREAFGFRPTGYEPQLCPREEATPGTRTVGCENPSQYSDQTSCEAAGCTWRQNPNIFTAVIYYCTTP